MPQGIIGSSIGFALVDGTAVVGSDLDVGDQQDLGQGFKPLQL